MEHKVVKSNFFKTKVPSDNLKNSNRESQSVVDKPEVQQGSNIEPIKENVSDTRQAPDPVKISNKVSYVMREASDFFEENNMKALVDGVKKIHKDNERDFFSVSVVGEFSRGKSSFINELLGKEYLPVGNLPSTAMLTRIRHNSKEVMVVFNEKKQKVKTVPFSDEAWDGLTADNIYGKDPKGAVLLGVNNTWIKENKVEIVDTPGAGDLEEERSKVISEALLCTDGAIITISANAPLSESEQLFIEQRLISKKIPFLMIIVTKLDLIPLKERSVVLDYIKKRLSLTKADGLPVYVPYDVEMPDDTYKDIIGMDKVKNEIISWIYHPERSKLVTQLIQGKMDNLFEAAKDSLNEKLALVEASDSDRQNMIKKKRDAILDAENIWEDLKVEMDGRYLECLKFFNSKIQEYTNNIVERLQYEAKRAQNPQKWWKEDYPYRVKVELANIATGVENNISRKVSEDINWFARTLNEKFKTRISVNKETVIEKDMFELSNANNSDGMILTDLTSQREKTRLGTTAISVVGAVALSMSGLGMFSIVATMGVGTGSSILSERFFKGKIEEQQNMVKEKIAEIVPQVVRDACAESERRLKDIYDNVVANATEEEKTWLKAQTDMLENSTKSEIVEKKERIIALIDEVTALQKKMYA